MHRGMASQSWNAFGQATDRCSSPNHMGLAEGVWAIMVVVHHQADGHGFPNDEAKKLRVTESPQKFCSGANLAGFLAVASNGSSNEPTNPNHWIASVSVFFSFYYYYYLFYSFSFTLTF
ncbi:hypothetical protein MLD38_026816 [Melastoma candidum]|uniref:Uncharacterized protein n=1 Tax=Melastoma candidum TaxID=119954 RepID=A0ACB9NZT1_9MYRT|nr:hypothetical protein MLD38_026816 [Melastoma candidum]